MGKFWKVLAGLGVAAATAGVVLSLAKKKNEEVYDEFDLEEDLCEGCEDENCDACKCEDCACEDDCSECECDEDCEECDCCIDFEEDDEEQVFRLVTSIRGNSMKNLISTESPIGKAILGKKVGDRVEVAVNDSYSYYIVIRKIENTTDDSHDAIRGY